MQHQILASSPVPSDHQVATQIREPQSSGDRAPGLQCRADREPARHLDFRKHRRNPIAQADRSSDRLYVGNARPRSTRGNIIWKRQFPSIRSGTACSPGRFGFITSFAECCDSGGQHVWPKGHAVSSAVARHDRLEGTRLPVRVREADVVICVGSTVEYTPPVNPPTPFSCISFAAREVMRIHRRVLRAGDIVSTRAHCTEAKPQRVTPSPRAQALSRTAIIRHDDGFPISRESSTMSRGAGSRRHRHFRRRCAQDVDVRMYRRASQ